jgi:nitrate/nitrite transport system substrate-binding protein
MAISMPPMCCTACYGVQMGIGGQKKDMAVLMSLNNNGQAITLSKKWPTRAASTAPRWPS